MPAQKKAAKKAAPKKTAAKKAAPKRSTKRFLRNANYSPFRLQLDRHDKGKFIQLRPRGERGDFAPLQKDDLDDPVLQNNVALGVVEIITEAEALEVAKNQTQNQQAVHPALSALRNELGEEYPPDAVKLEQSDEERGVVVAELDDGNVVVDRGGIRRKRVRGEAPGSPDGVTGAERTVHAPANEDPAYLSDLKARDKRTQGPEAGLGGVKRVTVAPPKKV